VVTNLLHNALSFSPAGATITVAGRYMETGDVEITVEEQGPGIPDDNLESIFERFYSERPSSEGYGDHSGLGLSISKQIVEAHRGRIWAENIRPADARRDTPPEGARFVVELPG
jgi:two-component system sensor histidine kinase ChvG